MYPHNAGYIDSRVSSDVPTDQDETSQIIKKTIRNTISSTNTKKEYERYDSSGKESFPSAPI